MRKGRRKRHWERGALAIAGLLSGTSWALAQPPFLPTGTTPIVQGPVDVGPPFNGRQWLKDTYIGRPDMFYEPPIGYFARNHAGVMKAKADPHRFTLYRTDFLPGTNKLSPTGAMRFNLMASRLPSWLGPVLIEWSPDEPGMAEGRRQAVLATLASIGQNVVPERVIIGPPLYPGTLGTDAANYYNVMITRDVSAPSALGLSPNSIGQAGFAGGGGGGGGGGAGGP